MEPAGVINVIPNKFSLKYDTKNLMENMLAQINADIFFKFHKL